MQEDNNSTTQVILQKMTYSLEGKKYTGKKNRVEVFDWSNYI